MNSTPSPPALSTSSMNERYAADDPLRKVNSAGAAVFRMKNGQPEVLVIRSGHKWSFPKGHVEPGETEESAALREVQEETGAQIHLLPGFRHEAPSPRHGDQRMVIGFAAEYLGGELRPQEGETDEVLWLSPEDAAARMRFPCDADFIRQAWAHAVKCLTHN